MALISPCFPYLSSTVFSHPQHSHLQNRYKASQATLRNFSASLTLCASQVKQRRSSHYHPSIWDPQFIESLKTPYTYERFVTRLEELKREAKRLLESTKEPSVRLKLIDSMQRLGVVYHFEEEIKEALDDMVYLERNGDLYTTALWFRLLRQNGYQASPDVFNEFKTKDGSFMDCLSGDAEGLLSLYEASHLGIHGEAVLEEAKEFTVKNLKSLVNHLEINLAEQVQHSLEVPLHWRMKRLEARNFINIYERDHTKNSILLELAKLDFNLVQSIHQRDLRELSRWWRHLALQENLNFSRDRLVENILWAIGIIFEPRFSRCRKGLTKMICILTAIDDIYDIYGSLDELELFTDAVDRWDVKAIEDFPNYMKLCYLAMFNFANGIVYDTQKEHGLSILPYIKNEWASLCKAYLVEARWFSNGYTPRLDEYLENAWISVAGPASMVHANLLLLGCTVSNESVGCLKHDSELFYWSSLITRLSDDLGTSEAEMERGDVAKCIQCYMKEKGVTEEEAREQIKGLVRDSWKKLNEECVNTELPRGVVNMALNMTRTAQCIFQHGDGIGTSNGVTKDRVISLLIEPIPLE